MEETETERKPMTERELLLMLIDMASPEAIHDICRFTMGRVSHQ